MSKLIKGLLTKNTFTENAMPAHSTSSSACLDLFTQLPSARHWEDRMILRKVEDAAEESLLTTLRILFWARDVRGGAGERRVFRVAMDFINAKYRKAINRNLHLFPFYGRWDDVFGLDNPLIFVLIEAGLEAGDGLLAKWLPRKGKFANAVRKHLNLTPKKYRKMLVRLSSTVEQKMCANKWTEIEYNHVPSVAMHKYNAAFRRHDESGFSKFISEVNEGRSKINASTLYPYQLYDSFIKGEDVKVIEAQWNALPNYIPEDSKYRMLPMCDVSGSMNCTYGSTSPMSISVSLGIYISERNKGIFKDSFLTFSGRPALQYLKGSFSDRCHALLKAAWGMNTNLSLAFGVILNTALKHNVPKDEMPNLLLIISDMQFDQCIKNPKDSALDMIKRRYEDAGYEFPKIVFWNVNARPGNTPVKFDDTDVAMVGGCSPSIVKGVLRSEIPTPYDLMVEVVNSERYQRVTA